MIECILLTPFVCEVYCKEPSSLRSQPVESLQVVRSECWKNVERNTGIMGSGGLGQRFVGKQY